jgi:hypothetical protein
MANKVEGLLVQFSLDGGANRVVGLPLILPGRAVELGNCYQCLTCSVAINAFESFSGLKIRTASEFER